MIEFIATVSGSVRPRRLPVIELHDRSPVHGLSWADAALALGVGTTAIALLVLVVWFLLRSHRQHVNPHEAAVMRLTRASRLSAGERRLIDLAAQRSKVDRLAILVAPSAFDRATALANLPMSECKPLRARLFGGRSR